VAQRSRWQIQADLPKGPRRKLTDAFIRALVRDWEAHGERVIERVREENPVAYFKGMLSLLPKDMFFEGHSSQSTVDSNLSAMLDFLDEVRRQYGDAPEEEEPSKARH
jgi:hypothetical protein